MRHNYQNFFTQDISPDTLSIMTNICLAQAQECILEKSLIDNRKSTITAKVALQIVEYYQLVFKTSDQMIKDAGQYSDKVIKAVKKWRKLVELKSHYYGSIALLYRGLQAEDETKYGDRVTFYKAALEKLNEASKCAKSVDKTDNIHDTIQFTYDVVQGKVTISEKENEFVYHEKVPELSAITSEIKGVSLVKGIPFKFDDPQIAGPDIFGRLVPIEAHEVSSLYSEEKAKILRHYSGKIEGKNETLDKMIIALQLDQIDLQSSTKKIPQELVDCCAALSVNKDAVKRLSDSMSKLSGMFHDVEGNLGEIEDILKEDEAKEKEHCDIMGTKRPPSNVWLELNREVQKYRSAHSVASETNQTLHEALSKHVGNLQILMKPFNEVIQHIPSFDDDDEADQEAISQMKRLIGKVDEMRKQRITLENQLRESIHSDDITSKIVIKVESDLMELFREELKKHDKITQILDQNLLAQDNIIRALTEANANYAETRKKTVQVMKRRDKVIEDLISSYESYDELLNKCNKGIEFYTKLDTNVQKLLQRVRSVCKVQEEERETAMNTLINKTKAMNFNNMSNHMPPVGANNVNLNMGQFVPKPGGNFQENFSISSTTGHLKLKDVLAMKKQPNQPVQPPSINNSVANNTPYSHNLVNPMQIQQNQQFYQPQTSVLPTQTFYGQGQYYSYPQQQQEHSSYPPPPQQQQGQQPSSYPSVLPSQQQPSSYPPVPPTQQQQGQQPSSYPSVPLSQQQQGQRPSSYPPVPPTQQQQGQQPSSYASAPPSQQQQGQQPSSYPSVPPAQQQQGQQPSSYASVPPSQQQQGQQPSSYPPPPQHQQGQQPLSYPPVLPSQQQSQQPPSHPPQEYNPNDSYLAKYVKQHMGAATVTSNRTSTSINSTLPNFFGLSSQSLASNQFPNVVPQQNQNPALNYQQPPTPQPLQTAQHGYQAGQGQQFQYPNSNNGFNNQSRVIDQQQNYYTPPNQQTPQSLPTSQQQSIYYMQGQPQGQGQFYPQQQQQPQAPPQKQAMSSNFDLLSDIDLNFSLPQPLTPAVIPNSNQENHS
ncbi:tyrosine-protein phosphatase non-receptor type 23 isoform X2 [Folsomia candida]|nr:tyrosine-protein phosphatase non-receptor type 23 isoform X2 [Folsomia candida]